MNYAIITPSEADAYLGTYPTWLAYTTEQKMEFIKKASVYVQLNYTCTGIDFDDAASIPDEVKEATAYFAMSQGAGQLYKDGDTPPEQMLSSKSVTAGSVSVSKSFHKSRALSSSPVGSTLGYPDGLMQLHCSKAAGTQAGCSTLIRV